jgi:hypothetical protein
MAQQKVKAAARQEMELRKEAEKKRIDKALALQKSADEKK